MQTSFALNQKVYPGNKGTINDCWVVASLMAAHAVIPWERLPGIVEFRRHAGDPDDGVSDGGTIDEIVKGLVGSFPVLKGKVKGHKGSAWSVLTTLLATGHPISVAVWSDLLPDRLEYGFKEAHQIALVQKGARCLLANPLAPVYSRWDEVPTWEALRDAIMGYGTKRVGARGAWFVSLPTESDAFKLHPLFQPAVAAANVVLTDKIAQLEASNTALLRQIATNAAVSQDAIASAEAATAALQVFTDHFKGGAQ